MEMCYLIWFSIFNSGLNTNVLIKIIFLVKSPHFIHTNEMYSYALKSFSFIFIDV